jgi:hypothetical protein
MINPTVTQAVAAERMADLRREAARYRAARKVKAGVPPQAGRRVAAVAVSQQNASQQSCEAASASQQTRKLAA